MKPPFVIVLHVECTGGRGRLQFQAGPIDFKHWSLWVSARLCPTNQQPALISIEAKQIHPRAPRGNLMHSGP